MVYAINFLSIETEMSEFIKMLYLVFCRTIQRYLCHVCVCMCALLFTVSEMPLVALCVRDQLECVELCLGTDDEPAENWWVRIEGQTNMCKVVRPPDYEVMYEVIFRQLEETLCLEALGLRRNLLTQVTKELMERMLCCTRYIQIRKNWSEM